MDAMINIPAANTLLYQVGLRYFMLNGLFLLTLKLLTWVTVIRPWVTVTHMSLHFTMHFTL